MLYTEIDFEDIKSLTWKDRMKLRKSFRRYKKPFFSGFILFCADQNVCKVVIPGIIPKRDKKFFIDLGYDITEDTLGTHKKRKFEGLLAFFVMRYPVLYFVNKYYNIKEDENTKLYLL